MHQLAFADRLCKRVQQTGSVACVGLDPRANSLPESLQPAEKGDPRQWAQAFERFCIEVIDVVADKVPVVKPQAAFFEQLGPAGMQALFNVIQHATSKGLLVIVDGKRNDIGSTAQAYAQAYLGQGSDSPWGSDALTVSPYLGSDSLEPFLQQCETVGAGIFVLVKTSNPGGGLLQDRQTESETVYQAVARLVEGFNEGRCGLFGYGPIGAVVGATYPDQLAKLRALMPRTIILIPGFGAQGGAAADVAAGFDASGLGAIVNNSRNLIFAYRRPEFSSRFGDLRWQDAVAAATDEMNQQLQHVLTD